MSIRFDQQKKVSLNHNLKESDGWGLGKIKEVEKDISSSPPSSISKQFSKIRRMCLK
jgi:hypothetical protein